MYRRYQIMVLAAMLCAETVPAQNLVPNPSFEQHRACPAGIMLYGSYFDTTVMDWRSGGISADYYNSCAATGTGVGIPINQFGSRYPRSGNGYVGIYLYDRYIVSSQLNREYVECMLQQPLQAGRQYSVSFYTGLAAHPDVVNLLATDQVGVSFNINAASATSYSVQVPGSFITDTAGWTRFHAVYTATGGERFMTIGNFYQGTYPNPASFYVMRSSSRQPVRHTAYIYIDDVCVYDLSDSSDMITINVKDTTVCAGADLVLHAPAGGFDPVWNTGAHTDSFPVKEPGTYWVKSFQTCGFSVDTFHVTMVAPERLDIGRDKSYCAGTTVTLTANHAFDHYIWNTGDTTPVITVTQTGQYILTAGNVCGQQQDTINITVLPEVPVPLAHDTIVCRYSALPQLRVEGVNVRWYRADDSLFTFSQPDISTDQPGIYTLYVTQTAGACESPRHPVSVTVLPLPGVILGRDTMICTGESLQLQVDYTEGMEYAWNTGAHGPEITVSGAGYYVVQVSNVCGAASDSISVDVIPCDRCIWLPSAFSPNSDGKNDGFRAKIFCPLTSFRMTVADRWGRVVFSAIDPAAYWDGTSGGRPVPVGTYYYFLEAHPDMPDAAKILLKGDVAVVR